MKAPTIPTILDALAHASDETRQDIDKIYNSLAILFGTQWAWRRTVRKIGPVLFKLRNGERLTAAEARLLLTVASSTVYLLARNIQAGIQAQQDLAEATIRLSAKAQSNTTKEQH